MTLNKDLSIALMVSEDEEFNISFHQILMLSFSPPGTQTDFESAADKDLRKRRTENDTAVTDQFNSNITPEPKGEILCFFRRFVGN